MAPNDSFKSTKHLNVLKIKYFYFICWTSSIKWHRNGKRAWEVISFAKCWIWVSVSVYMWDLYVLESVIASDYTIHLKINAVNWCWNYLRIQIYIYNLTKYVRNEIWYICGALISNGKVPRNNRGENLRAFSWNRKRDILDQNNDRKIHSLKWVNI